MKYIEDEILMSYIKDNECIKELVGMETEYYCKETVMTSFPELTLQFRDLKWRFRLKECSNAILRKIAFIK